MGISRGPARKPRQGRVERWERGPVPPESMCAWCRREIPDGQEVLGVSATPMPDVDLEPYRGQIVEVTLFVSGKRLPVIVAGKGSEAERDGKDMIFMVCSDSCAAQLQAELKREISQGDAAP